MYDPLDVWYKYVTKAQEFFPNIGKKVQPPESNISKKKSPSNHIESTKNRDNKNTINDIIWTLD